MPYGPVHEILVLIVQKPPITLYLKQAPFDAFANRADPDQAALIRAA